MKGVNFHGADIIMGAPKGHENEIKGLPVKKDVIDNIPTYLSIWEPDEEERKAIAEGGVIELAIFSATHPPVSLVVREGSIVNRND